MSKHIIQITREYTTSTGTTGVCYTLKGKRAASFVPRGVDALGWLLGSLGLAKEEAMAWEVNLENSRKRKSWMASCGLKSEGRYLSFEFLDCSYKEGGKRYTVSEPGVYVTVERKDRIHWLYEGGEEAREITEEEAIAHLQENLDARDVMGEIRSLAAVGKFRQARARIDELPREEARPLRRWLLDTMEPHVMLGAPELEGTEKQVAWANDLRIEKLLTAAINVDLAWGRKDRYQIEAFTVLLKYATHAKHWIDTRDHTGAMEFAQNLKLDEETQLDIEDEINARIKAAEKGEEE